MQGTLTNLEKKIITKAAKIQIRALMDIYSSDISDYVQQYLDQNVINKLEFLEQLTLQMQSFEELAKSPDIVFNMDELYIMLICVSINNRITKFPKTRQSLHRKLVMAGDMNNTFNLN